MVTTVDEAPGGFSGHLRTWVQAIAVVYLIAFAMVLVCAVIVLPVRGAIELLSWAAALLR